jgi:hypothetical protein
VDDTAGLASGDNLPELFNSVNIEIKKIARWFRANKMAVNVGKTKYIIFHTRGKAINNNLRLIYDDNEPDEHNENLIYGLERIQCPPSKVRGPGNICDFSNTRKYMTRTYFYRCFKL